MMKGDSRLNASPSLDSLPAWALPVLGVLIAVQLALDIWALIVLLRTSDDRLVFGKKWPWLLIILLVNTIGAIVFLAAGRTAAPVSEGAGVGAVPEAPAGDRAANAADLLYGPRDAAGRDGDRQ